jgi:hypothetical protein
MGMLRRREREIRVIPASQKNVTNRNDECFNEMSFVLMMRYRIKKL